MARAHRTVSASPERFLGEEKADFTQTFYKDRDEMSVLPQLLCCFLCTVRFLEQKAKVKRESSIYRYNKQSSIRLNKISKGRNKQQKFDNILSDERAHTSLYRRSI